MQVTKGNAFVDGQAFHHWFVGDIESWCRQNHMPYQPAQFGLRQTTALEIKWAVHKKGTERPGGWAADSGQTTVSMLIRGRFVIQTRDANRETDYTEHRLINEGDYIIWQGDSEHIWRAEEDSLVLTVRWPDEHTG